MIVLALVLIGCAQLLLASACLPPSERWFLHVDDLESFRYGQGVLETGLPRIPADERGPRLSTNYSVWGPLEASQDEDGNGYSRRPPGVFYVLAPFTSLGIPDYFVAVQVVNVLSSVASFFFFRTWLSERASVVATAMYCIAAPIVFWTDFGMSNLVAIGIFSIGTWLLHRTGPRLAALGGFLLGLSVLFRYEFVVFLVFIGSGWFIWRWKAGGLRRIHDWLPALAAAVGLALVGLQTYHDHGTFNFISVTRQVDASASDTVASTAGAIDVSLLMARLREYGTILIPMGLFGALGIARSRERRPTLLMLAGAMLLLSVFFAGQYVYPQRFLMSNAFTRYFLPLVLVGCLGFGFLFRSRAIGAKVLALIAALLISANVALVASPAGFVGAKNVLGEYRKYVNDSEVLPANAILVGDRPAKIEIHRLTLTVLDVPEPSRGPELRKLVGELMSRDYRLFGVHTDDSQYKRWLTETGEFRIEPSVSPSHYEIRRA